jgi:hypothetical protein
MKLLKLPSDPPGDPIGTDGKGIPVLRAYTSSTDGHLAAWCKHCRQWHHHGRGVGHRWAHCMKPDSPYHRTRYILRVRP